MGWEVGVPSDMNFTRHLAQLRKLWEFLMKGNFPEARRQGGRFSHANSVLFRLRTESYSCGSVLSALWSGVVPDCQLPIWVDPSSITSEQQRHAIHRACVLSVAGFCVTRPTLPGDEARRWGRV